MIIYTEEAPKHAVNVLFSDRVLTDTYSTKLTVVTHVQRQPCLNVFFGSKFHQRVLRTSLQFGQRVLLADGKFKTVEELKVDDHLAFNAQMSIGCVTHLPTGGPKLTTQIAHWLGLLFADGYVASDGTTVGIACDELHHKSLIKAAQLGFEQFGVKPHLKEEKGATCIKVRAFSKNLNEYLSQFKRPFVPLNIPDCIWCGTPATRAAFLGGVFDGDGSISVCGNLDLCCSKYLAFIQQQQILWSSLGVITYVSKRVHLDKRTNKEYTSYKLKPLGNNKNNLKNVCDILIDFSFKFKLNKYMHSLPEHEETLFPVRITEVSPGSPQDFFNIYTASKRYVFGHGFIGEN